MKLNYRQKNNGMYILSKSDIEEIATQILEDYAPKNLVIPTPLDTVDLLENHLGLTVKRKYIGTFSSGILGLIVLSDTAEIPSYDDMFRPVVLEETYGTVLISQHLTSRERLPRQRYTEAHEGSHFILHREYFSNSSRSAACRDKGEKGYIACRSVGNHSQKPGSDAQWMEWQADALAAALLMPKNVFYDYARWVMSKRGMFCGYLINGGGSNSKNYYEIISEIAEKFHVSCMAAEIRMIHLGLIKQIALYKA